MKRKHANKVRSVVITLAALAITGMDGGGCRSGPGCSCLPHQEDQTTSPLFVPPSSSTPTSATTPTEPTNPNQPPVGN